MKKTTQLRNLLNSKNIEIIMEAHNGLTAKLVEEAGFKAIWGSGLAISAGLGVRDNNEASWTQVLEVMEFMCDAVDIPVLLDGDTGHGNFNNMRRFVKKLEQRGVAGVCIEDKLFPKTNSFIAGEQQPLADINEFSLKIKAGKDSQTDPDFNIIARTEALIAGWGMEEAIKRATAYYKAGADAILIHSKIKTASQVIEFAKRWNEPCPVVCVPTMYPDETLENLHKAGINAVIWANHLVRTVITSVRHNLKKLKESNTLMSIENEIAAVKDIFAVQNADELKQAEKLYLPVSTQTKVIMLAASQGKDLGKLTENKPKCMIPIKGKPIISKLIETFNDCGIKNVNVVRGFKKDKVNLTNVNYIDHDNFDGTGETLTLFQALKLIEDKTVIAYGDIICEKHILSQLLDSEDDITIVVDLEIKDHKPEDIVREVDYVVANRKLTTTYQEGKSVLEEVGPQIKHENAHGEWIGLINLSAEGSKIVNSTLVEMSKEAGFENTNLTDVLNRIIKNGHNVVILSIYGQWLDIDTLEDLSKAYLFE